MIRYIPFTEIQDALEGQPVEELIADDPGLVMAVENVLSSNYSNEEIAKALSLLKLDGAIVFHGWIAQHPVLLNFMQNGVVGNLAVTATVANHQLFPSFQKFTTAYLQEQLLQYKVKDDDELASLFSFVNLLDKEVRDVVENQLFKPIHQRVKALTDEAPDLDENELQNAVTILLSESILSCVNSLSKAMYREKVFFVESFLDLIRSGACTPRLSNWILKQLDGVKLNKEHNDKLLDIRKDLKSGKIKGLKTVTKNRSVFRPRQLITKLLGVVAFAVLIFYFFTNNEKTVDELDSNSSFKTFTKEERVQLDSIIQILQAKHNSARFDIDTTSTGHLIMPSYLSMRRSFNNPLLEQIYEDWNKDGILQDLYPPGTSISQKNISRRTGEKPLSSKPGTIKVSLVNESAYSLIFYTGKNEINGSVYSEYIPQDTTIQLLLNVDDVFFIVAGRSLQKFETPSGVAPDLLPGFNFKEHFGSTDDNYLESINSPYLVKKSLPELRILVQGSKRDYFSVVELDGALELY